MVASMWQKHSAVPVAVPVIIRKDNPQNGCSLILAIHGCGVGDDSKNCPNLPANDFFHKGRLYKGFARLTAVCCWILSTKKSEKKKDENIVFPRISLSPNYFMVIVPTFQAWGRAAVGIAVLSFFKNSVCGAGTTKGQNLSALPFCNSLRNFGQKTD